MAYIGKEPADSFISFAKQDFSTSATTSYTLDNAVTNENELALFINFVRQEPTTAYTASGTTLTLTSATASTDDMYCVYLGQAKQTVNAPDGSVGSSQVASTMITGQTAETSIATDDTVLIHDTSAGALRKMTRANFVSGVGGTNTPVFRAYLNANQSLANNSDTTVVFNAESFDPQSTFDTSTGRFTPAVSGKYFLKANVKLSATNDGGIFEIYLRQNTSTISAFRIRGSGAGDIHIPISDVVVSDADDYFEIKIYHAVGSSINANGGENQTFFTGYKIIE